MAMLDDPERGWSTLTSARVSVYALRLAADGADSRSLRGDPERRFRDLCSRARPANPSLTDLNPQTEDWKLPSVQHITWKAPDGTEVGGAAGTAATAGRRATSRCRWSSPSTAGRPPPATADLALRPAQRPALLRRQGLRRALPELPRLDRLRRQVRHRPDRPRERHRGEGHPRRHPAPDQGRHRRPGAHRASWAGATAATSPTA